MRILIVKLSSIGDIVHTLPAAAWLRRALPDAQLAWVAERRASEILKDCPAVDELIELDTRAWRKQPLSRQTTAEVRSQLNNIGGADRRVDIAIDFQGLIKSGLVAAASRARRRIGFETADLREKASRAFLTEQVVTSGITHVIEKNLALARRAILAAGEADQPRVPYEFPIAVSAEDERYVEEITSGLAGKFAILNPGGGWPTKLWSAAKFGEIADYLANERGVKSFVTFGPGEESLAEQVASSSRAQAARPVASTLKQFVALARRAQLFVGGDTGPLHLAAACGTPIVGLYGPTSPHRNGPFRSGDIAVGRDLWCRAACHRRSCWHWECMEITAAEVKRAISARLAINGDSVR
jgi:lipopolysaccharide heptosyltransferase I